MILQIGGVLEEASVSDIRTTLMKDAAAFQPGAATAGWQARAVKNNEQAQGAAAARAVAEVEKALSAHPVFRAAARPKALVGLLVSRYQPGMAYGTHVDDAMMKGVRTDLSFTVFLSDPASYEGGELVIEGNDGDQMIKLPAGAAVLYPSTTLHRVAEVTAGERLVVLGAEQVRHVQQGAGLIGDRRGDLGVGVAERGDREPAQQVEVSVAVDVVEPGPFAAHEHHRRRPVGRHDRAPRELGRCVHVLGVLAHGAWFLSRRGRASLLRRRCRM